LGLLPKYNWGIKIEKDEFGGGGACGMEEKKNTYSILVGLSEGKSHFEELGVDGKIILRWT
jgi:hypothetical protein